VNKKFYLIISFFFSLTIWISIALSDYYYSTYTLPLNIIDVPENYTPSSKLPEFVRVKLKAEGWKLIPLEFGTQKYFFVSVKNDSVSFTENLLSSIELNPWYNNKMNILEITPKNLKINLVPKVERKIKIKPILNLGFKKGFGLASEIIIEPDSILLKGPANEIDFIKEIETLPIQYKNLDKSISSTVEIRKIKGFETDLSNVKVYLDVQRIIENTISDVNISIENLPKNIDLVLIPKTVNIILRGGIEYFSKYDNNDIIAKIDYKDVVSDTLGYLRPEIHIPKHFSLISVKPDIIKYIIKQY
jgi:hypothetical protein